MRIFRVMVAVLLPVTALATCSRTLSIPSGITRVAVAVGDDSCYVAPLTDSVRIARLLQFVAARPAPWRSGGPIGLGGVHAELYRGPRRVATFGVAPDRAHFEYYRASGQADYFQAASAVQADSFLKLIGLPPGTNAGLGLPIFRCPAPAS